MIIREPLLFDAPLDLQRAFYYLNNRLFIYDAFVFATSSNQLEHIESFQKRIESKISKPNWIRELKSSNGILFFINMGSKKMKSNKHIKWAIDEFVSKYDSTFTIDVLEKNEKFDVYFIGVKKQKQTEIENENAN